MRGAYSKLYQQRMRIEQRTAKGQWGTTTGDDDIREVPSADLVPLSRGIEELDKRHHRGIAEFTQKLPSQVGGRGAGVGGGETGAKGGQGRRCSKDSVSAWQLGGIGGTVTGLCTQLPAPFSSSKSFMCCR